MTTEPDRREPGLEGGRPDELGPAADRGTTSVADRVVERIAGRAADEVTGVRPRPRRLPGRADAPSVAEAQVDGEIALLSLRVAVAYPAELATVAQEVADRVTDRVRALCELRVQHVDVEIEALVSGSPDRPRVL